MAKTCLLTFDAGGKKGHCMRARELKSELLGDIVVRCSPRNPPGERDVVYVTKNIPKEHAKTVRRYHTVYEPVDLAWKSKTLDEYVAEIGRASRPHQALIVNSNHLKSLLTNRLGLEVPVTTVYHEYDKRLRLNATAHTQRAFYIGMLEKSSLTAGDLLRFGIEHVATFDGEFFTSRPVKGVHVDFVREDRVVHHVHTSTKLATCMALRSVFVCNRIPVYVELLGEDYEFFVRDDLADFARVLDRARAVCADADALGAYLASVRPVSEKLSPESVRDAYSEVFREEMKRVLGGQES